jgi:hypothetical protein
MAVLENEQHESFAQARFDGKTLVEAHYAAGCAGDKASASRLNQLHEVKERIAELYRERAADTAYEKTHALRDLLAIIHTAPSDASEDHPLCEVRMGKNGPYHRLPGKLQAMSRLIKLMGWDNPVQSEVEEVDTLRDWLIKERKHDPLKSPLPFLASQSPAPSCSSSIECSEAAERVEGAEPAERVDGLTEPPPAPGPGLREPGPPDLGPNGTAPSDFSSSPSTACQSFRNGSTTAQQVLPPRHESFALARVKGLGIMAAYHDAGYTGDTPNLAWRLNSLPAVQARIAELNGGVADAVGYRRDDAIRDLVAIIRAHPKEAGPDHPLCEERMTSWGPYHRFPSKLAAITLLMKILGWKDLKPPSPPRDTLKEWLESMGMLTA